MTKDEIENSPLKNLVERCRCQTARELLGDLTDELEVARGVGIHGLADLAISCDRCGNTGLLLTQAGHTLATVLASLTKAKP